MKQIIKYGIVTVLLVFAANGNAIAQKYTLNLDECRALALDSNKRIISSQLQELKLDYDRKAVISKFLPRFSGYGYYLYASNDFTYNFPGGALPVYNNVLGNLVPDYMRDAAGNVVYNNGIPVFNKYAMIPAMDISVDVSNTFVGGIMVEQPIFMGLKIVSAYQMAKIGTEMAGLNTQMNRSEVIVQVDEAYWMYVRASQLHEAANSFRKTVDEMYNLVNNAVEVGMATSNDLLKVQVQQNNAKLQQSKSKNGMRLALMNLCHNLGLPLTTQFDVDQSDFEITHKEEIYDGSIEQRYDYQLLNKKVELKEKEIAFKRSDFLPQIGVMANYGYRYGVKLFNSPLLDNDGFSALASVKIPIFAWGEGYFKVKSAEKERDMAIQETRQLEEMMELEKTKYQLAVTDAQLQVDLTRSSLESAEMNLKTSQDQYDVGMETLVNVLESQTQWHKAKSDYIEAVAEYKLSYTKFLKAVGQLE